MRGWKKSEVMEKYARKWIEIMDKKDTVIFDLDGTLLNTLEDLRDSVNVVMQKYGYPVHSLEEIRDRKSVV